MNRLSFLSSLVLWHCSLLALLLLLFCPGKSLGLTQPPSSDKSRSSLLTSEGELLPKAFIDQRRGFLNKAAAAAFSLTLPSQPASAADDRLFRPNPLTNPLLEQIRILEQAEKDNIGPYKGELEKGNAGNKGQVDAYPSLLVPILQIDRELNAVRDLVRSSVVAVQSSEDTTTTSSNKPTNNKPSPEALSKALTILQQPTYDKTTFKKTFNKYGDNIYYSDPDRANLYLGGGATPKTEQSIAYLLRNDVLTNMENLRAEIEYLLKNADETDTEYLFQYADICVNAMTKYLAQVPPKELEQAKRLLLSTK